MGPIFFVWIYLSLAGCYDGEFDLWGCWVIIAEEIEVKLCVDLVVKK